MNNLLIEFYNNAVNDLLTIKKQKLLLSERVALERALAKLDAMSELAIRINVPPKIIRNRIKLGWELEKITKTPVRKRCKKTIKCVGGATLMMK